MNKVTGAVTGEDEPVRARPRDYSRLTELLPTKPALTDDEHIPTDNLPNDEKQAKLNRQKVYTELEAA